MVRWVILAVLVVVLSTAATVAVQLVSVSSSPGDNPAFPVANKSVSKGPKPKAVIVEGGSTTHEFGTLPQRVTGKHTWVVKNTGQADLDLWMISSTCSCTLARFKNGEKAAVKPGESTDIVLEFETRENNGDYTKGAEIGTSDPDFPQFSLQVHGKVYPAIQTVPPGSMVNFMNVSTDIEEHIQRVAVFSVDRPEMKILKATSSKPKEIVATYEPLTDKEARELQVLKGYKVTIDLKQGLPLGVFREEVVLTTDHPKQPELRLAVTGKMGGPINLIPDRLLMHQVDGKTGGRGEMIISVRSSRETKFTVASSPKNIKVEIVPNENPAKGPVHARGHHPPWHSRPGDRGRDRAQDRPPHGRGADGPREHLDPERPVTRREAAPGRRRGPLRCRSLDRGTCERGPKTEPVVPGATHHGC